jgi:hypothetical protein
MNKTFTLMPATRTFTDQGPSLYSDYMLSELLAMHEELLGRLRIERQEAAGDTADCLANMITQHEKDAAQLRMLLLDPAPGVF